MLRLTPAPFSALIADLGQTVLWRRATMCPCRDPYSGAARQDCPVCLGRGVFWALGEPSYLALTGLSQRRQFEHFGPIEAGDVVLTIPEDTPAYQASESDQIMLLHSDQPWNGIFTRGSLNERWPPGVFDVQEVTTITGNAVTRHDPPADLPSLSAGGPPIWGSASAPAPGQQYSVRARRRPTYFLLSDFPQARHHHQGLALPRRVTARKIDLFGRDGMTA